MARLHGPRGQRARHTDDVPVGDYGGKALARTAAKAWCEAVAEDISEAPSVDGACAPEVSATTLGDATKVYGAVVPPASEAPMHREIIDSCDRIRAMLLDKNRKYGNSALSPLRVFSKASDEEQILVRIDDKLSRIRSGQADDNEDVIDDLIGYLHLLKIARAHRARL